MTAVGNNNNHNNNKGGQPAGEQPRAEPNVEKEEEAKEEDEEAAGERGMRKEIRERKRRESRKQMNSMMSPSLVAPEVAVASRKKQKLADPEKALPRTYQPSIRLRSSLSVYVSSASVLRCNVISGSCSSSNLSTAAPLTHLSFCAYVFFLFFFVPRVLHFTLA